VNDQDTIRRAGNAAVVAGGFVFVGHVGGIAFAASSDAVLALFVASFPLAAAALGLAVWSLRGIPGRVGLGGIRVGLFGSLCLVVFGAQSLVSVWRTGELPDTYAVLGTGVVTLLVGQTLLALDLRRRLIGAWPLLAAADVGLMLSLVDVGPSRDLGLILFECAWVAFGLLLFRAAQQIGDVPVARAAS
jgi:hypothetical protein